MSLFPSASFADSDQTKSNTDTGTSSKSWLENKSFGSEASNLLINEQQKTNQHEAANSQFISDIVEDPSKQSDSHSDVIPSDTSSDECEPSLKDAQKIEVVDVTVDKRPDKNNLYFNKPYKVFIPKYRRGAAVCVGLSPHLEIIFEKNRKRKKVKSKPRYYQMDEQLLATDHEVEDLIVSQKLRAEKLNIETRENAANIEAWLELVALQDDTSGKNIKLKTEKKVAILDKAISVNPRNYHLKLKRLELLESISEDSDREWKNLVFNHPECKEAWMAYIRHTLSSSRFTVQRTLKVFEKCLETLSAIRKQAHRAVSAIETIEDDMMTMFAKLVQFLVESGYTERVVTLLLLMLEINVRSQTPKDLADVKHFYDSGVPLLGQANSKGWEEWYQKFERGGWMSQDSGGVEDADLEEDVDDVIDFDKSVNENWLRMESKRGKNNILPWRSEEDCEDPGRKVHFDDVRGFLFIANETKSRIKIFEIFLQVLGTVPQNNLISSKLLLTQPCHLTHAVLSNEVLGDVSALHSVTCSDCSLGLLPRTPHHELLLAVIEQLGVSSSQNIRRQIANLAMGYCNVRMSSLRLKPGVKAELKKTYKEARKIAKNILRDDPDDFLLWAKLVKLEHLNKNSNECKKITYNGLSMCKKQSDALLLCRTYAELEYDSDSDSVKRVLSALADGQTFTSYLQEEKAVSAAVLLRASRSLERLCEDLGCLYQQVEVNYDCEPSEFANAVCCHFLYGIVTSSPLTTDTMFNYLKMFRSAKASGSQQAVYDLRFIHALNISFTTPDYLRNNSFRRSLLSALQDLPDEPEFLGKLCQIEIGSSLTSVARRLLSSSSNPILIFYSVFFELLRIHNSDPSHRSPIPPRVLNILERGVTVISDNILLWRMYASMSPNADTVLIRANASCPWSKTLACDRVRSEETIEDVIKYMQDKGLRIRTPVEEVQLLVAT